MLRVLRASEHHTYLWKNGHGSTTQILVHPEQASVDTFEYRINTASVTKDDPFSRLPGVKRTMFIVEGGGLRLTLADGKQVDVTRGAPPFVFDGERETEARLIDGPTVDLNVMTRSRFRHTAERIAVDSETRRTVDGSPVLLLCDTGSVSVSTPDGAAALGPMDAAVAQNQRASRWIIAATQPASVYLFSLQPA